MNKVYYKTVDEQVGRDNVPPDGMPVYIESVEVRTVGVVMADTEVVITYRLAGGTEVEHDSPTLKDFADAMRDRLPSQGVPVGKRQLRIHREAPETDGTWGPDDEAGLIRDMEDEIPMPGGPFGDGMK